MRHIVFVCLLLLLPVTAHAQTPWITGHPSAGDMALKGASIVYDDADAAVISVAAHDLARDMGRVTGQTPAIGSQAARQIWIGTVGHSALIDSLGAKLDLSRLKGCWECFVISVVDHPKPGVEQALVIAGSDRRGAAYGAYEVSRAIGVSPWVWWADVTPKHQDALYAAAGTHRFGPPSVKYRGIFINDEDWGLEPWAAKTFDPATGNFGPKTYERVFDLLLRLRANTLWPAMHKVSKAFNLDPANAALADRYAIVMGSSHAEPMLRNNVGEWTDDPANFNYATHPDEVKAYWRARLKTNGKYENIYTLGMRGIHDSAMVGAKTSEEKRALLNRVLHDQRQLLADEVGAPDTLPQVFVPYKEVLDVYRTGLDLPDDVTIMWPDDNFGYIRQFPDAAERKRSGGSGVYYHLEYLGGPVSYIWLSTTPPALIGEEMGRAYDHGARRMWIFNVGDIKPAEIDISYAFDLAWNIADTRRLTQKQWLTRFSAETFGAPQAARIGDVLDRYYQLNFERRPEQLQWYWGKGVKPVASPLSAPAIDARVAAFDALRRDADAASTQSDAYFELVGYPVAASALANRRYFALECLEAAKPCKVSGEAPARVADDAITALDARYNRLQDGKWAGLINEEPADGQWSFRTAPPPWPGSKQALSPAPAETVTRLPLPVAKGWTRIAGMGRSGYVLRADGRSPLTIKGVVQGRLRIAILPTFPANGAKAWRLSVSVNGRAAQVLTYPRDDLDKGWEAGVMANRLVQDAGTVSGPVTVAITPLDPGVIVEGIEAVR
ncbi:glycosyl hydrolase 115 family protein [Asticcacaulis sp. EMRT-3]|uniref:glycosyl hydrolase 115 family protein n=1 Tax=Asticcacaulis sp. EMRT-3 TaxID=3040349 RepID=UPI0024AEF637|nr:glycosyl hydrolase 115 family protein [Asticcacaulis sp. EMRT-3]MDI7774912.1 glycosyl hydrolase 115 family protein [Asticcacaulis sp. EMRT-3]